MTKFYIGDRVWIVWYSTPADPTIDPWRLLVPPIRAIGTVRYSTHNRAIYGVEFEGFGVLEMFAVELARVRDGE